MKGGVKGFRSARVRKQNLGYSTEGVMLCLFSGRALECGNDATCSSHSNRKCRKSEIKHQERA